MKFQWKALLICLAVALGTGVLSALLTPSIQENYAQLYRPPLAPPGWVFPVVWTVLYVLMGLASFLIYVSDDARKRGALVLYGIQLVLLFLWPLLFFRFGAYVPAFILLMILWIVAYLLIRRFYEIDELAGKLMFPYLLWLTFAAYLNFAIAFAG